MTDASSLPKPRVIDRVFGPSPRERALEDQIGQIEATFAQFSLKHENLVIDAASGEVHTVHEALQNIDLMLDAQGWTSIFEYDDDRGLTLKQVKEASRQLRELVVGNPFIGNGRRIRTAQTHGGGCDFAAQNRTNKKIKPLPARIQTLMEEPWSQRYLFGNKARNEMESAVFTDGTVFALGRDGDKRMQRVQLQEITGALHNPNNSEEVWAYRREWTVGTQDPNNQPEKRVRWYYTDMVPREERRRSIRTRGGQLETAEPEYTMIDMAFNRQVGWAFGVPDALCVVAWARLYKEFLVNGYVMSRSLARLAYKITVAGAQAGNNAALTIAAPGQGGGAFVEGSGNQLSPLSTAGKGYDFGSGNALAGAIAAGLGVSLLALLSNPAAASGSNAAAQTLDPIAKATAAVRRREWNDEYLRLFKFMGLDQRLVVTWYDLPEDTLARLMQAWTLVDAMEVFDGDVMFREVARVMNVGDPGELLAGWKRKSERTGPDAGTFGQSGVDPRGRDDGSGQSPDDHDDDKPTDASAN